MKTGRDQSKAAADRGHREPGDRKGSPLGLWGGALLTPGAWTSSLQIVGVKFRRPEPRLWELGKQPEGGHPSGTSCLAWAHVGGEEEPTVGSAAQLRFACSWPCRLTG